MKNVYPSQNMKSFWRISTVMLLYCVSSLSAVVLDIVTTDTQMMYVLQKQSAKIAIKENVQVSISFVQERKSTRYFQLGNVGDVLVTSSRSLCNYLSAKGLSSSNYSVLMKEEIYCTAFAGKNARHILVLLSGEYTSFAKERIDEISHRINASLDFLTKNDNTYEKIADYIKSGVNVCGFYSLFQDINFDKKTLINQGEEIKYYACPLIGLNGNAYNALIKYFHETQDDS